VKLYWRVKRNGKWTWTPAESREYNDACVVVSKINIQCEAIEGE